jgi:hypothetical protein
MAAPSTPEKQPFLFSTYDTIYGDHIVGSVADNLFVVERNGTGSTELALYQVGSPPTQMQVVTLPAAVWYYPGSLNYRQENDSGAVAFIALDLTSNAFYLCNVSLVGGLLDLHMTVISGSIACMVVSGDGNEVVLQTANVGSSCDILGYTRTGILNWSCSLPQDNEHAGYLIGAPVAGKFVWANNSPSQFSVFITATVDSNVWEGGQDIANVSFDLSSLSGRTVALSWIQAGWYFSGTVGSAPSGGHAYVDGVQAPGNLGADYFGTGGTAYFTGSVWAVSASVDTAPVSSSTIVADDSGFPWIFQSASLVALIDNSGANGGRIELRNAEGIISYVSTPDPLLTGPGQWVTTGVGRVAFVRASAGGAPG